MKKSLAILLTLAFVFAAACSKSQPTYAPASAAPSAAPQTSTAGGETGSSEALAAVLGAREQADEVGSFKMTFSFTMSGLDALGAAGQIPGTSGGQAELFTGSGEVDAAAESMHMTMNILSMGDIEMIQSGDQVYMRAPMLTSMLGTKKKWIQFPAAALGSEGMSSMGGQSDPSQMLESLRGVGSVTEVGSETIDGVETTHYSAVIDPAAAMADLSPEEQAEMQASLAQFEELGLTTIPVEIWVDGDGLPRRMVMSFEVDPSAMGMPATGTTPGAKITMAMTIDFTDFGAPVTITPPPANQVEEAPPALTDAATQGSVPGDTEELPDSGTMPSLPPLPGA